MIYPLPPPSLSFLPRFFVSCSFFFFFVNALTHLWNDLLDGGQKIEHTPPGITKPGLVFFWLYFFELGLRDGTRLGGDRGKA